VRAIGAAIVVATACGGSVAGGDSCLDGGSCPSGSVCHPSGECVPAGSGGSGVGGNVVTTGGLGGNGYGGSSFGGSGAVGGSGAFGGSGGVGGATTPQARLGRACETDAECGAGLFCASSTSGLFDGGGPAKGLCTTACVPGGSECQPFDPDAVCVASQPGPGFCIEGCSFGPDSLQQFDPSKCHGRTEVACSPVVDPSGQVAAACVPNCNGDQDCGSGWFCHPSDGLCRPNPPTGKLVGEVCQTPDAGPSAGECQGSCIPMAGASGIAKVNVCTAGCTFGAIPACGWQGPTSGLPSPAACLFVSSSVIDNGGPGVGDLGYCGALCGCDGDCAPTLVCEPFGNPQIESFYQQKGYCVPADGATGMPCN
jgi:hypothetical protein